MIRRSLVVRRPSPPVRARAEVSWGGLTRYLASLERRRAPALAVAPRRHARFAACPVWFWFEG